MRSSINGFVTELDDSECMASFMSLISEQDDLWSRLLMVATEWAAKADVVRFIQPVINLITLGERSLILVVGHAAEIMSAGSMWAALEIDMAKPRDAGRSLFIRKRSSMRT